MGRREQMACCVIGDALVEVMMARKGMGVVVGTGGEAAARGADDGCGEWGGTSRAGRERRGGGCLAKMMRVGGIGGWMCG